MTFTLSGKSEHYWENYYSLATVKWFCRSNPLNQFTQH